MFGLKKKPQEKKSDEISLTQEELDSLEFTEDSNEINLGNIEEEEIIEGLEIQNESQEAEPSQEPIHPIVQYFSDLENKIYELEIKTNQLIEYINKTGVDKK